MTQPSGIFVIDKPEGISSAKMVAIVKGILRARKVGHTGTLDPFATGVMVCCVNQATKLARFFLEGAKRYEATLSLGVETDTQDATGSVTATCGETAFSSAEIRSVLDGFVGEIQQQPPVYSALKHRGVPLYRLARQGRPVQKPPRRVHISSIRLLSADFRELRFVVTCSAGTYVRTLCADIGARLGCGGHLSRLRRIVAGGFHIDQALQISTLEALAGSGRAFERMVPMAEALRDFPEVVADGPVARKIHHGNPLLKTEVRLKAGDEKKYIKVVDRDRRLLAVLKSCGDKGTYGYECVLGA